MTALMSLFSCAGISANAGLNQEINFSPGIKEKFNFNIQSVIVRKELKMVDTKNLTPGNVLEIKLLKKIAMVSKKEDLQAVFDVMWENDKIFRSILNHPDQTNEYIPSLALTYYLLSSTIGTSWQKETSERLYHDVFEQLENHKLSGYPLHFYILALLNNGKFQAALPWLERLKQNISAQIYAENLQKAFIMAEDGRDVETAIQLLSMICINKTQNKIKIDEDKIDFAVISMIKKGYINSLKSKFGLLSNEYPELKKVSFVKRINEYTIVHNIAKKSSKPGVWVKVQVIKADNQSHYIDPDLETVYRELQKTLNYSGLKLMDTKVFYLNTGDKAQMKILPKTSAKILAQKTDGSTSRLKIVITKKEKEIFNTIIESIDKGVTVIGGPQIKKSSILLRMTTYNEYSL